MRLRLGGRTLAHVGVAFFLVACTFTYYGQLHRKQSGDTYGTVYTAVALVQKHTIWLDSYLPYVQSRAGDHPYMLTTSSSGHVITATPTASSILALPLVAVFDAAGTAAGDFGTWLEAGMLTAALAAAAAAAIVFVLLTRLTTRPRAALIAITYAWGTLAWQINGQALWQHGGVALALAVGMLALVDRRLVLAGAALTAMGAFRLTAPIMAVCLLPLIGRKPSDWGRFLLGALPLPLALAAYNVIAFGSPLKQGYGSGQISSGLHLTVSRLVESVPGLLVSPGRGLFVYSPVLLFAVYGAVRGWRVPLYRLSALAIVLYVIFAANLDWWFGGESFGARKLADTLPLFAVLLVPALDGIAGTRWMKVFGAALAWSIGIELLGAAAWNDKWFGTHNLRHAGIWWHPTDNEIVSLLSAGSTYPRLALMAAIAAAGVALGVLVETMWRELRPTRDQYVVPSTPA